MEPSKHGAHKRTPAERQHDIELISDLYLKGLSFNKIASEIGTKRPYTLSVATVASDMGKVIKKWEEQRISLIGKHKAILLAKLKKVENEAWAAWERSQGEKVERTTKQGGVIANERIQAPDYATQQVKRSQPVGESKWLNIILRCIEEQANLMGVHNITPEMPDGAEEPTAVPTEISFTVVGRKRNDHITALEIEGPDSSPIK